MVSNDSSNSNDINFKEANRCLINVFRIYAAGFFWHI